ncbi:MAG: hypothetical protein ACJAXS_000198 [Colwellia sp.]|jgi:hypothetical protein
MCCLRADFELSIDVVEQAEKTKDNIKSKIIFMRCICHP